MAKYKLGDNLPQKRVLGMALDLAPDVLRFEAAQQTNDARHAIKTEFSFLSTRTGSTGTSAWT